MKDEDKDKEIPEPNETVDDVSAVDEAKSVLAEIKKEKEDLKIENDRKAKLQADELLSSTAGKRVEAPKVSEEQKKIDDAAEYFKGSQLEKDIRKANE